MEDPPFRHKQFLPRTFGHVLNLHTLPAVTEGEWGYVIRQDGEILLYDDDDAVCICDAGDECEYDWESAGPDFNPFEQSICACGTVDCNKYTRKHVHHMFKSEALCYETAFQHGISGGRLNTMYYTLPHDVLSAFPENYEGVNVEVPSRRDGYLYMIAAQPDLSLHRMKCGFTTDPPQRLSSYKTLCPRLLILGMWEADKPHESWYHAFCHVTTKVHVCRGAFDMRSQRSLIFTTRSRPWLPLRRRSMRC